MAKFYLIQRGTFEKSGKYLTGSDGVVNLDLNPKKTHHMIDATVISGGALILKNRMETGWLFYNLIQICLQRL